MCNMNSPQHFQGIVVKCRNAEHAIVQVLIVKNAFHRWAFSGDSECKRGNQLGQARMGKDLSLPNLQNISSHT